MGKRDLVTVLTIWFAQTTLVYTQHVTVETSVGTVVGHLETVHFNGTELRIKEFLGIPYAKAPVGELRFEKPERKQPFTAPFIAQTPPPFCQQNPAYLEFFGISLSADVQSEDCLRLNIFMPRDDREAGTKRAVLVWIHGGFYEVETQNWYLAKMLAASQDIIYVTLNYRLSVLGFLSTGDSSLTGNNGLWDQRLAIEWVYENIESFGGDRNRLRIAGESAGSAAVIHHALYRDTNDKQLFKGVIAQSGSANNEFMLEANPLDQFVEFTTKVGCFSRNCTATLSCLKGKAVEDLMGELTLDLTFPPVVDGEFVKMHPNDVFRNENGVADDILDIYRKYDVIFGLNSDEGALYLGSVDGLVATSGDDQMSGYTLDAFENKIIPFVMNTTKRKDTPVLRSAVMNQYLDFRRPRDQNMIRQSSVDLLSDTLFNIDVLQSANAHAHTNTSGRTFLYLFDHRSILSIDGIKGVNHAEEVIFALGFPLNQLLYFYGIELQDPASQFTQDDLHLSLNMMEYWSNFVKTGLVIFLRFFVTP